MTLILGDCLNAMRDLPDASVDAVVTDPPYGISFMGKHWDAFDIEERVGKRDVSKLGVRLTGGADSPNRKQTSRTASAFANRAGAAGDYDLSPRGNLAFQEWTRAWATEALRILKPGGHLLSFASTRTYHRMACGVEEAGFEIRDTLAWMFGSGFPKSLDVSKAIDARAGATREVIEERTGPRPGNHGGGGQYGHGDDRSVTAAATPEARAWDGWGTALKPAFEPIVLARKPLVGTVAANVLEHGTGALNIDACRIGTEGGTTSDGPPNYKNDVYGRGMGGAPAVALDAGRWPANVLLNDDAAAILDAQTGILTSGPESDRGHRRNADSEASRNAYGGFQGQTATGVLYGDSGGASRFFYCAKVSRAERNAGLDGFEEHVGKRTQAGGDDTRGRPLPVERNNHPTVKPIDLMRWLIRLTVRPGGTILDPFGGSGSTGCAAELEGVDYIIIEREADYMRIIEARTAFWREHGEDGLRICRERDAAEYRRQAIAEAGQLDLLEAA